jgi:hypothetical protein
MNTTNPTTKPTPTMKTNETNTPEPLAAILAEMREWSTDENDALARYADRIEAAVERRVKEAKDGIWRNAEEIHDIHCNDCTFRAALYKIVKLALAKIPKMGLGKRDLKA